MKEEMAEAERKKKENLAQAKTYAVGSSSEINVEHYRSRYYETLKELKTIRQQLRRIVLLTHRDVLHHDRERNYLSQLLVEMQAQCSRIEAASTPIGQYSSAGPLSFVVNGSALDASVGGGIDEARSPVIVDLRLANEEDSRLDVPRYEFTASLSAADDFHGSPSMAEDGTQMGAEFGSMRSTAGGLALHNGGGILRRGTPQRKEARKPGGPKLPVSEWGNEFDFSTVGRSKVKERLTHSLAQDADVDAYYRSEGADPQQLLSTSSRPGSAKQGKGERGAADSEGGKVQSSVAMSPIDALDPRPRSALR